MTNKWDDEELSSGLEGKNTEVFIDWKNAFEHKIISFFQIKLTIGVLVKIMNMGHESHSFWK
jgi:hypothetical protein